MTRIFLNISRFVTGLLFIFSGLVKANDPLGLSYKMQEFFELWGLHGLNEYSLAFSIVIIAFEIVAGVALLIGWQMRSISWLLLLLIIFFTFLTGYAYLSGQFKNCGCFGDCIPITPLTSFIKDMVLLVLIAFIFYHRNKIHRVFGTKTNNSLVLFATVFSFAFQWYVLTYNPVVDCLPLKKGNNISQQMQVPENAITDSFAIRFIYEKNDKEFSFAPAELPADLDTYTFKERKDELVRQGNAEPPLKGFALVTLQDEDLTQNILQDTGYVLLLFVNENGTGKINEIISSDFSSVIQIARQNNWPVYAVSNTAANIVQAIKTTGLDIPVLKIDFTAFRTAARANPTLYLLKKGTVIDKWTLAEDNNAMSTLKKL